MYNPTLREARERREYIMTVKYKCSYSTQRCIDYFKLHFNEIPKRVIDDIRRLLCILEKLSETASKKTHYDKLDEWNKPIYDFASDTLKRFGFVNGNPEANAKNPPAEFWWRVYQILGDVIYSPHLKSQTENHHSSAWERNEALKCEFCYLLGEIETN
jgi:hypothetical protein